MCIAIVKTKDATISDDTLQKCWDSNPDGAGFAYPSGGQVVIEKGFFKFKKFLKNFRKAEKKHPHAPMLIHFRISTSGLIDKTNCHPHRISSKLVMIHNGVLHIDVPKDSKVSDTVLYCKNYLQKLPEGFEHSDVLLEYITEHIGTGNKFCFLNNKGEYAICNEKAGTWDNGVWYSNTSYKWARVTSKYSTYWNSKYDDDYDDYYTYNYGATNLGGTENIFGYGKVQKPTAYSYLTPDEVQYLLKDNDLYEDVCENIDMYTDEQVLALGRNPYVHLLTGKLISEKTYDAQYNKSRFVLLKDYDGDEGGLYSVWQTYYDAMLLDDSDTTESTDVDEVVAVCSKCSSEFSANTVATDENLSAGICPLCGGQITVGAGSKFE